MKKTHFLNTLATLAVSLVALDMWASFFHWYDLIWWFDMPMHFLGGTVVLYLVVVVWKKYYPNTEYSPKFLIYSSVFALAMSLGWELFEFSLYHIFRNPIFIPLDTLSDIFFDIAGILTGLFFVIKRLSVEAL